MNLENGLQVRSHEDFPLPIYVSNDIESLSQASGSLSLEQNKNSFVWNHHLPPPLVSTLSLPVILHVCSYMCEQGIMNLIPGRAICGTYGKIHG